MHSVALHHLQQDAIDKGPAIPYCENMKLHLNASEVARLLDVDRATISRWIKKGIIKEARRPRGTRQWRIPLSTYAKFMKDESR